MHRKFLFPFIGLAAAVTLAGCSSKTDTKETELSQDAPEETAVEDVDLDEFVSETESELTLDPIDPSSYLLDDVSDYITLGSLDNLSVTEYTYDITDDMVQEYIDNELMMYSEENEVTTASAEGNTVYVDMSYTFDGQDDEEPTEESTYYIIGDEECGAEFDQYLTGVTTDDTLSFDITFDDSIMNEEWAGQTMHFDITVTGVWETIVPEYTDEFVQTNTDYSTKEEFETALRDYLTSEYASLSYSDAIEDLLQSVQDNSVISECPEDLLASCQEEIEDSYAAFAEYFGIDDFYEAFDITEQEIEEEASTLAARRLTVNAILLDAGVEMTEADYIAYLEEQADANGYDSAAEFEQDYTRISSVWSFFEQKAGEILYQSADITREAYTEESIDAEILDEDTFEEEETEIVSESVAE